MEVAERRRKELRERVEAARRFAEKARRALAPATAVIVGSTARGDFNVWSDIDVVIVSERFSENPLERFDVLIGFLEAGVEPIPLRPKDVYRLSEKNAPLVEEIANGIVIYDELGIVPRLKAKLLAPGRSRGG